MNHFPDCAYNGLSTLYSVASYFNFNSLIWWITWDLIPSSAPERPPPPLPSHFLTKLSVEKGFFSVSYSYRRLKSPKQPWARQLTPQPCVWSPSTCCVHHMRTCEEAFTDLQALQKLALGACLCQRWQVTPKLTPYWVVKILIGSQQKATLLIAGGRRVIHKVQRTPVHI